MSKNNIKKKIVFCLSIFMMCLISLCGILTFDDDHKNLQHSNAVTEYINSGEIIPNLYKPNKQYNDSYDMTMYYPLSAENQTDSNFCWIYSSLKVLESSLMIQRNEYHNFSEIGSAYLYYLNITKGDNKNNSGIINTTGNFGNFNILTQNYGLIYESSFSNDLYDEITEENYENYSYILDYVDTNLMSDIRPIDIKGDVSFASLRQANKVQVMKEYILTYGGMFAGLEEGLISGGMYYQTDEPAYSENDKKLEQHAVCIIGWNDSKNAFLVLNSWGVERNTYSTFYVPYDYEYLYSDLYGYICLDKNTTVFEETNTEAGGTDGFSSKVNSNFVDQNNLFVYGEDFEISYKITGIADFDNIYLNIFKGLENVTNEFSIDFYDDTQTITIKSNSPETLGSGYFVKFLDIDKVVGYKDFYIFTGTEFSYIKLIQDTISDSNPNGITDSTLFNNLLASGKHTQTYYVNNDNNADYNLNMYLLGINNFTKANINVLPIQSYLLSDDGSGNKSFVLTNLIYAKVESTGTINNLIRINIADLALDNSGKVFMVQVPLESRITNAQVVYNFIFFISKQTQIRTELANKVVYELDGGKNNPLNTNIYPNYNFENDINVSAYPLFSPTKFNSTFIGWYLDKEFTKEISEISKETLANLGDVVIYARWEEEEVNYFNINLSISKIVDYYKNEKEYTGQKIIYGDSLVLKFEFTPNTEKLTTYKYLARYDYSFNGKFLEQEYLENEGDIVYFKNSFVEDNLVCGTYKATIKVLMVISHQFSVSKEIELSYEIKQKDDITVTYDKNTLKYVYDKKEHIPSVSFSGIYEKDLEDISFEFNIDPVVNVGKYTFIVNSISNKNYALTGNLSAVLEIETKKIQIEWNNIEKVYNGSYLYPDYKILNTIDDEEVEVSFSETGTGNKFQKKNVGTYNISVSDVTNKNYQFEGVTNTEFKITQAKITITFGNISERFTIAPNNRKKVEYTITGDLYDAKETLNIAYDTLGESTLSSGVYPIVGKYATENEVNKNYETTFVNGTYTILGYYYVYYTLPNGEEYVETVDEGFAPKGITKEIYKKPLFSKYVYDKELINNGLTDLYVNVEIKSYAWVVWFGIILVVFIFIYFKSTKKQRRNKTR